MLNDMAFYIEYIAIATALLLLALLVALLKRYRQYILDEILAFKNRFVWGGFIRGMTVSSIQKCMTVGIQIRLWMKSSPEQTEKDIKAAFSLLAYLVCFPIIIFLILAFIVHKELMDNPRVKQMFEILYAGVHKKRKSALLTFMPVFFFKRITYVAIPTVLLLFPGL